MFALLVAAALLSTSGCSFALVQPPPDHPVPGDRLYCTTSYAGPTIDVVLALLHVVSMGVVASSSGDAYGGSKSRQLLVNLEAPWLGAEIGAAIWGFRKVNACNELLATPAPYHPRGHPRAYVPPPAQGQEPGIEPGASSEPDHPRGSPRAYKPPTTPGQEPGIEPGVTREPDGPPKPGSEPGIEPPAPPAPRIRQQIDSE